MPIHSCQSEQYTRGRPAVYIGYTYGARRWTCEKIMGATMPYELLWGHVPPVPPPRFRCPGSNAYGGATEFPSDRISCDLHRKFCRNVQQNFLGNTVALIKMSDRTS